MVTSSARVWFKAGETIMRQGEPGNSAYIIESGRVEILFEKPDGRMQCVGTRGSDTMIGEMALVDDAPRTATVRAIEDCTLLEISKEDFSRRLRQADPVLRMTAQVILNRYRDMLERAELTGPEPAIPAEAREVSNAERKQVVECVRLTNEFKDALNAGELDLYYQPIYSLRSGEIQGFEALMRWQHPVRGAISPALFIPVAENSGLIVQASAWVLREACAALRRIEAATGRKGLFMSVNLSSVDFIAPGIVNRVYESLVRSGIDPGQLHLEITERLLMDQPERARAILEEFHAIGVQIAIDDFGTGYSSLSYLHSFPIDILKIDRSFVMAMRKDARSLELVRSIISLGRNLGIKVIAEGVELREEVAALANLACDEAQGYYFAKPLAESHMAGLVAEGATAGLAAALNGPDVVRQAAYG
jgi:EAL domain-containing protein (putative c-di-GMP-specific phosphodiesterase class I)/CRP-like cAMP-binding protein